MTYKISQSSLKEFEDQENCPFRWKELHITKSIRSKDFPAAAGGKYFEYLCLGTDTGCTSLPPLKNGNPGIEEKRIIEQSEIFKSFHDPKSDVFRGLHIIHTDILLENEDSKGIVDYVVEDDKGNKFFMDLKLVLDLYNGYYRYGDHNNADYTQQVFYKRLMNTLGYKDAKVGLFIFEKGKSLRIKEMLPIEVSSQSLESIDFRINKAYEVIDHYNNNGWTKYPSVTECSKCPLDCNKRIKDECKEVIEVPNKENKLFESIKIEI